MATQTWTWRWGNFRFATAIARCDQTQKGRGGWIFPPLLILSFHNSRVSRCVYVCIAGIKNETSPAPRSLEFPLVGQAVINRPRNFVNSTSCIRGTWCCGQLHAKIVDRKEISRIYIYIHVSNIFLFIVRGEKFPFEFYFRGKYLEKNSNVSVELHCTLLCTILGRIEGVDRVKIALFFQPSRIDRLNRSSRAYDVKFENWANRRRKGDTGRAVELGSFHSLILNTLNFEDEHRSSERSFSRMFRPTFLSLSISREIYEGPQRPALLSSSSLIIIRRSRPMHHRFELNSA